MAFKDVRRQKFMSEAVYNDYEPELRYRINRFGLNITEVGLEQDVKASFAWKVASDYLKLLIIHYTGGKPLDELAKELPELVNAFDTFIALEISPRRDTPPRHEADTLEITQLEAYVYVIWLLALSKLLGHAELIQTVMKWIDKNAEFNRGRDGLFEAIVERLTGEHIETERFLFHADAYRPLAKATVAESADRPTLMKEFVENWYKHMKPCYWHGSHTDKAGASSYFGYWCFEAALVTYLWDIDDSSYRDHLVYPKDLVDFAREHFPFDGQPSVNPGHRCEAGVSCPREGYWRSPAAENSRRLFKEGDIMPDLHSDWGRTIWYWDEDQS